MQNLGNAMKSASLKGKFVTIALILLLAISSAVILLPQTAAVSTDFQSGYVIGNPSPSQIPANMPTIATSAGLTVSPDPVDVGQTVSMIMWVNFLPPSRGVEATTVVTGGWQYYNLVVTKPDGTTDSYGPYESDVSGMNEVHFTPTIEGNYSAKFTFTGMLVFNVTWGGNNAHDYYYNAYYLPSTRTQTFTVSTSTPATAYTPAPLPTDNQYWSRSINGQNRDWYSIAGPWLQSGYNASGNFNPYTTAPGSAHILWTEQMYTNGLIGGDYGSLQLGRSTGFSTPIIMCGRLYYNGPPDLSNGTSVSKFYCANLETGQVEWSAPGSISFGQILNWRSQQSKSEIPYLWSTGSTYTMYDAYTGNIVHQFTGASTGTTIQTVVHPTEVGQTLGGATGGGGLLVYSSGYISNRSAIPTAKVYPVYSSTQKFPQDVTYNGIWVSKWNSTKAIAELSRSYVTNSSSETVYRLPAGASIWSIGLEWNKTFTDLPNGGAGYAGYYGQVVMTDQGPVQANPGGGMNGVSGQDGIILFNNGGNYTNAVNQAQMFALSADTGQRLWIKDYLGVPGSYYSAPNSVSHNQFSFFFRENYTMMTFDAATGNYKWSHTFDGNDFIQFGGASGTPAYGNLYIATYDGYVTSLNAATGALNWKTLVHDSGLEMPEIGYPLSSCSVADGKVYTSSSKSYETEPLYRGHKLTCLDATTGAQIWNISGQMTTQTIAMGYLLTTNNYDGSVYCFGKGQTATTVTAPMTQIVAGSKAVIQGTVMDKSPAQPDTPAISDNDQTAWMEYLHMDQANPTSATGVPVSLDAIDPNGNFVHVGDTHSDATGAFSYVWTPPSIAGQYNIIASFFGSKSYYMSEGETSAVVVDAPAATTAPVVAANPPYEMYTLGVGIAVIIAIAIVAVLLLRKKP